MLRVTHNVESGSGRLRAERAEAPVPGEGELLVRAEAIGVTLPTVRKARETAGPIVLGGEVAGTVVAAGPGVTEFAVGERVTGLCFADAYAQFVVLGAAMASRIPADASAVDAVALVRGGLVARGACEAGRIDKGDAVLVTAAASGVGTLAVQLARQAGAGRVTAAVGSAAKSGFVLGLGADAVVTYDDPDWGGPFDVVLDGVGGDLLGPAVRALGTGGRLVAFGSGGGTVEAYELLLRGASVIGFQMRHLAFGRPELCARWRDELWRQRADGTLRTAVHAEIPLAEAARAHALIEQRRNLGKVVLVP